MKNTVAISLIIISLVCCKKKDPAPSPTPTQTGGSTTGGTPSGTFSGFLPLERYGSWYNGFVSYPVNPYQCKMQLYSTPVSDHSIWLAAKLGTLSVNGNILKFENIKIYSDTVFNPYANYATQKIVSLTSTVLPSFTYTVTETFPDYTSANAVLIKDTLKLSTTFTVPLNGLANYDKAYCSITTVPTNINLIISKEVNAGVNQITFSPSELSGFTSGQQLNCKLILKKYNTQIFGGKNFRFECWSYNDFYMVAK